MVMERGVRGVLGWGLYGNGKRGHLKGNRARYEKWNRGGYGKVKTGDMETGRWRRETKRGR